MSTHSFLDHSATIAGPGGFVDIGVGSGTAEEGFDIDRTADTNTMTIGADGTGMHNLSADRSGTIIARFLKNSAANGKLQKMYNAQRESSLLWGQNEITVRNPIRGDLIVCLEVAFKRDAPYKAAKEGGIVEWSFDAIIIDKTTGNGFPEI